MTTDPSTMNIVYSTGRYSLRDSQRTAAAALFNAVRMLKPNDNLAQNNYAFCILVDKPEEAKNLLAGLLERGVKDPAVRLGVFLLSPSPASGNVDAR